MNQPLRFSSAASLVVLGSMMAGCAAPQARTNAATYFGGKADGDVGLATRALAALNSNNVPAAIGLAERAVAKSPKDAGFRALLGNAYFAGGRFRSAEAAYGDSLALYPNQPQIVLKFALVQIAQGKNEQAGAFLKAARSMLDASDYGLALALAGRPNEAIAVLEPVARAPGADATIRQNLALANAFAGNWDNARAIAGQDVHADQLDVRMQQWMLLSKPAHASDQVAALVGVKPASADTGQPVQLALNKGDVRLAEVAPAPVPPVPVQHSAAAAETAMPAFAAVVPTPAPVTTLAVAPAPPPPRSTIATLAASAVSGAKDLLSAVMPHYNSTVAEKPHRAIIQRAAVRVGNSPAVVQLGAYRSPDRVLAAWNGAAHKYGTLKAYVPMSARFASPKGTFYRLSVRGFNSLGEATALCTSLKRNGGSCFVRNVAGDAPVQYAAS